MSSTTANAIRPNSKNLFIRVLSPARAYVSRRSHSTWRSRLKCGVIVVRFRRGRSAAKGSPAGNALLPDISACFQLDAAHIIRIIIFCTQSVTHRADNTGYRILHWTAFWIPVEVKAFWLSGRETLELPLAVFCRDPAFQVRHIASDHDTSRVYRCRRVNEHW